MRVLGQNMLYSGYLNQAQQALNYVRSRVRYRGLNTAGGWIRNPTEVSQKFVARIYSTYLGNKRSAEYKGDFDPVVYINELEKLAYQSQTGNCSELSAVAFKYLVNSQVAPIEYFGVFRGAWNHAFIILNRPEGSSLSDLKSWSSQAVVCDPLYDRAGEAGMLAVWYPRMFPLIEKDLFVRVTG